MISWQAPRGRREVEMPSRENAGPEFSAGEFPPRLQRAGMRDIVGAAERGDRTSQCDPSDRLHTPPPVQDRPARPAAEPRISFRALHDRCRRAAKTVQNGKQFVVRPQAFRRRIGGSAVGPSAAGNEQMHGGAAIDRAQLPGRFIGHPGTHAVAKKAERHRHQRLERVVQLLHERAHGGEGWLVEARGAARQLHRTEIDLGRHEAPQGQVERGISRSVRKAEKATANGRGFRPKWNPPVERHCIHRSRSAARPRTVPDQEVTRKTRAISKLPIAGHRVAAAGGAR